LNVVFSTVSVAALLAYLYIQMNMYEDEYMNIHEDVLLCVEFILFGCQFR